MIIKIKKIFKIIGAAFISLLLVLILGSQTLKFIEKDKVKAKGVMVEVDGKKMHVYSEGKGEKTIVLLSGLGTVAPSIDFKPLIEEFKNDYRVVVVETFGYGFSDKTDKERSAENIVNEIREALAKASINGPYILMPHSISSVYSDYYSRKYPNEVEAVIHIDGTLTKYVYSNPSEVDKKEGLKSRILATTANLIGGDRLAYKNRFKPVECFTEEDKKNLVIMGARNPFNYAMKNELDMLVSNCNSVMALNASRNIPVLRFGAIEGISEHDKNYMKLFDDEINGLKKAKCVFLTGKHYLHYTKAKVIGDEARKFLKEVKEAQIKNKGDFNI